MAETIKSIETKYSHNPNSREYVLFPEEYFSGSQVSIFLGHKHLVDCAGFSFALQEQHKPIYGYASRIFDEMSIGNRIVIGQFKVAFKDAGRLNAILNEVETYSQDTRGVTELFLESNDIPAWVGENYKPEMLLGQAMKNDPNKINTDLNIIKIYLREVRLYFPVDTPAILRQADDGNSYAFFPIKWLLLSLGYPIEKILQIGPNEFSFTHRDNSSIIIVNYVAHTVKYNGNYIPLMAFDFEDREYVHIRPICEALGYCVQWTENTKTVRII